MKGVDAMSNEDLKKEYYIDRRISEESDILTGVLEQRGLHLIQAPTDAGKTYSLLNKADGIFEKLAKKYPNRNFIIACPNRVQNLQNQSAYHVFALVGGATVDINKHVTSMVYEKASEVLDEYLGAKKELTLVIDEAHQLVYAENYRGEAVEMLEKLSEKAYNTIHLTATPRVLLDCYNYDSVIEFKLTNPQNANNLEKLYIVPVDDIDNSLIHQIRTINNNDKKALVLIDSKDSIEFYKEFLTKYKLRTGTVTGDNKKGNELYNSIINKSKIPDDYDVALGTSALECGTNILNKNIVMIIVVKRKDRFNLDKVEQGFARLRTKNEYSLLLIKNYEQKEKLNILDKDVVKSMLRFEVDKVVRQMERIIEVLAENNTKEDVLVIARANLNIVKANGSRVGMGIVEIDDECNVVVNEKAFVVKVNQTYDAQFLDNNKELCEYLKGHVKADKIVITDTYVKCDEKAQQDLDEIKQASKEVKEDLDKRARDIILKYGTNELFRQFVEDKQVLDLINISTQNRENFDFLDAQKKQIKVIRDMVLKHNIDFKTTMEIYKLHEKQSEIKQKIKEYTYVMSNLAIPLGELKLDGNYEYALIRRILDNVCIRQARVTDSVIEEIVEDLIMYKEFTKYKAWQKYKDAVNKDKEKKFGPIKKDILARISLIYNVCATSDNGYKVTSLKKTFNY